MIYIYINQYNRALTNSLTLTAYATLVKSSASTGKKTFPLISVKNEQNSATGYTKALRKALNWLRTNGKQNQFTLVMATDNFASNNDRAQYRKLGFTNLHFTQAQTNQEATLTQLSKQTAIKVNKFVQKKRQEHKLAHARMVKKQEHERKLKEQKIAREKRAKEVEAQRKRDIAKLVQKLHDSEHGISKFFAQHQDAVMNLDNLVHHRPITKTAQSQIDKITLRPETTTLSPSVKNSLVATVSSLKARIQNVNSVAQQQSTVATQQSAIKNQLNQQRNYQEQQQQSLNNQKAQSASQPAPSPVQPNPNRADVAQTDISNNNTSNQTAVKLQCLLETINGLISLPKRSVIHGSDVSGWLNNNSQYTNYVMNYLIQKKYIAKSATGTYKVQIGRYHRFL